MNTELILVVFDFFTVNAIGYCRVAPVLFLLPFFSSGNVPSTVKIPVIGIVSFSLFPAQNISINSFELSFWICIIVKELIIGFVLGLVLTLPFWIFHAVGSFIDNQRGATLSSTLDPSSGIDSSELSKFLNMFAAVIYLENDGMHHLVSVFNNSYILFEPFNFKMPALHSFINYLSKLMKNTIQISSPVIVLLLISEIFLGLLSRYASQLNAFSVSLTIKSGFALFILLLYFNPVFLDKMITLTPEANFIKIFTAE